MLHKNLAPQDAHSPSQEQVENNTGSDISALKAVKYVGIGALYPSITVANATDDVRGLTQSVIQNGSKGYILAYGMLYNVNTSAWPVGTSLFADASGNLTDVSGGGPQVANVLKQHATLGVIQVTCLDTPAAGTTLVQDTDSIDLDTLGSFIAADLNLSANPASTDNLKATATIQSGPSKGLHIEYPFADISTDGVLRATDWEYFDAKVESDDARLSIENVLRVKKNPGVGEFSSIKAAIDSITDASSSNRYVVEVGPGIYIEDTINMKSWVWLAGIDGIQTVIQVDDPSKDVIVGAPYSSISNVLLTGATDPGSRAIYYSTNDPSNAAIFIVEHMRFGENNILAVAEGITEESQIFINNAKFGGIYSFNEGFIAKSSGAPGRIQLRNTTSTDGLPIPLPTTLCLSDGPESQIVVNGLQVRAVAGVAGTAFRVRDGGMLRLLSSNISGFSKGIWVENVGAAPSLRCDAVAFENNNIMELVVDHPGASGYVSRPSDYNKIYINPLSTVYIPGKDLNIITVAKRGGDFTSVKAAVDSISDNSSSNRYVIDVGPGVYEEDTITLKPYIDIQGVTSEQSIIKANGPNKHLFIGSVNSQILACTLTGVSGSGYALVKLLGVSGTISQEVMFIKRCFLGESDILVHAQGGTGDAVIFIEGTHLGIAPFNTGFLVDKVGTGVGRIVIRNSSTVGGTTSPHPTNLFNVHGPGCDLAISSCLFRHALGSPSGVGVRVYDGARARVYNTSFRGMSSALLIENTGAAPSLEVAAITCAFNTNDITVDHPNTTGSITGSAAFSKIDMSSVINPDFAVSIVDPEEPGLFINGKILYAEKSPAGAVDIGPLVTNGATMGVLEGGELSDGGTFDVDVTAGFGYCISDELGAHKLEKIEWSAQTLTLSANLDVYIYVTSLGALASGASRPSTVGNILLGRVVTNGSSIEAIDSSSVHAHHISNHFDEMNRDAIGALFASGCTVSANVTPRKLDITDGLYYFSSTAIRPAGGSAISWTKISRNGIGNWIITPGQDLVPNDKYDNNTGVEQPVSTGKYTRHFLYSVGEGANLKRYLSLSQAQYDTLDEARQGNAPNYPSWFRDGIVRIASIIMQEGVSTIVEIKDERPQLGAVATGSSAVSDHGALTGLADDDHLQYTRVDGTRAFTGSISLGGNNITNVNLVDGVDVSAHQSRHLPNGADPLTTAAPAVAVGGNTTNDVGIANSLARSDHQHDVATGAPSTITPDQANAEGTSNNLARADHIHNIPADVAVGLNANSTNTEGTGSAFARNDHTHDLATGAASAQAPDQANAEGSSINLARADHTHNIPTAAPIQINANGTNAQGTAVTFARADHKHDIATAAPVTQTPDQANAAGSSSSLARADHVHNIPADAPTTTLSPATTNAEGAGTSFARNDHTHAIATALVANITTIQPDDTASAGVANTFARGDHRHAIAADVAVGLNANSTNTEGTSTSFARADHTHAVATGVPSTQAPDQANAEGTSTSLARADHIHNIPAATAVAIDTSSTSTEGTGSNFARADHTHAVSVVNSEVSSTASATTTSLTDVLISGMTITPSAGTYLVWFGSQLSINGASSNIFYNIYSGGTKVAHTERNLRPGNGTPTTASTSCIVTVNGSQAIEARWRVDGNTVTSIARSMNCIKLSN